MRTAPHGQQNGSACLSVNPLRLFPGTGVRDQDALPPSGVGINGSRGVLFRPPPPPRSAAERRYSRLSIRTRRFGSLCHALCFQFRLLERSSLKSGMKGSFLSFEEIPRPNDPACQESIC